MLRYEDALEEIKKTGNVRGAEMMQVRNCHKDRKQRNDEVTKLLRLQIESKVKFHNEWRRDISEGLTSKKEKQEKQLE